MDYRAKTIQTQLRNIEAQTCKSLSELETEIASWGDQKHGERRQKLIENHRLSFVHADTLLLCIEQMAAERSGTAPSDPLASIYQGAHAQLRPVYDRFMDSLAGWDAFEIAPKKGYVSLRRKKQFCMIGPATNTRIALGLNAKGLEPAGRLRALPPGKLCPLEVILTSPNDVTAELIGWVRTAFEQAA